MFMMEVLNLIDDEVDKRKFEEMYEEYKNIIFWLALKYLNNRELAEDCLQEVFTYAAINFKKIDVENKKKTKSYLLTVTKGKAISIYRKEDLRKTVSLDIEQVDVVDEEVFDNFDKFELSCAIDLLNDEYKSILYLKYTYGLTSKEISKMMGISDALVRKKLQFALSDLKKIMSKED